MDLQHSENFATFCNNILTRPCKKGLLVCGSFHEQALEYAMLNLTDLDHLSVDRTLIAATEETVIPKNFYGEILTFETNNCHLGFARLLRRHGEETEYFVRRRKHLHGPATIRRIVTWPKVSNIFRSATMFKPDLKAFEELTADYVYSVTCLSWPSEAGEWIIRKRSNSWPPRDMIDKIVAYGCHLVSKSHQSNPNDNTCCRFSFSQAELILLNSWNEIQKYIYHILRLLKSEVIEKCGGEKKTFLCTYYFKTLIMWAFEKKPSTFWSEDRIGAAIEELLLQMIQWLIDKCCPNYFIRDNNMLDYLRSDLDVSIEVLLLNVARQDIPTVVSRHPKVYRGKMIHIRVSDKALLMAQLTLNRRVFINALNQTRGRYIVKELSSSGLLRREVEHLFRAVQLHRLLMSARSSTEPEINERRKSFETEALSYFRTSYNRKDTCNYTDVFISTVDSFPCIVNKFLCRSLSERRQRVCCYRRTDEGNVTREAMEAICQTIIST